MKTHPITDSRDFDEFSPKLSYADDWIDTFLTDSKGCVNDYKWSVVRPVYS